jgi:hypothetical protein
VEAAPVSALYPHINGVKMGTLATIVPSLSPLIRSAVPPSKFLSPVLADRAQRLADEAVRAGERAASRRRAAMAHEATASRQRDRHARLKAGARLVLLGEAARAALGYRVLRPQMVVVEGGGFSTWDRYIVSAVAHECDARRARAAVADIDVKSRDLGFMSAATSRRAEAANDASRSAQRSMGNALLAHSIKSASDLSQEAEEARLDRRRDKLADRLRERSHPVDAKTLQPVIIQRTNREVSRVRMMKTASRFKGGRRALTHMMADRDRLASEKESSPQVMEFGQVLITRERILSIKAQVELERNRRVVPLVWCDLDVDLWMIGAYETLLRLPMQVRPREFGNAMPKPADHASTDWGDELARLTLDDEEAAPTFGRAKLRALGLPDQVDIDRMNVALHWPFDYLADGEPKVAKCVGYGALWKALDFPVDIIKENVDFALSMHYHDFDVMRGEGLRTIASRLNAKNCRRAVF